MILTKKLLVQWDACQEGIAFCERNKLFGFDLSRIDEIKGDHDYFISWIKRKLYTEKEYDSNGNMIKEEDCYGGWTKFAYDNNGNKIKQEDSFDNWIKWEYDSQGNKIKEENSDGDWIKWEYDSNGNMIKEDNSNDYWTKWEYDERGNKIKYEYFDGYICQRETEYYPNGQLKRIGELELPLV